MRGRAVESQSGGTNCLDECTQNPVNGGEATISQVIAAPDMPIDGQLSEILRTWCAASRGYSRS